jgi:hypothetical protein
VNCHDSGLPDVLSRETEEYLSPDQLLDGKKGQLWSCPLFADIASPLDGWLAVPGVEPAEAHHRLEAEPAEELGMFAPPLLSMLTVFPNNHAEVNAGAPIALFAQPMQTKDDFANAFAAFPEFFVAFMKILPQFLWNALCAGRRSSCRQTDNGHQSKPSVCFHAKAFPSVFPSTRENCPPFESKLGLADDSSV